jgi:tetratricopeptide (TPR) repeat protein
MYRDVFALYETTLARNPASWVAHLNLGTALDEVGETEQSVHHLQRALELKPGFPETLNSLGNGLNRLGRSPEALPLLEQAVRIEPRFASAYNTLGVALMALGRMDEGIEKFGGAVRLDPSLIIARVNLGWALANRGRFAEAIEHFEQVRRMRPDSADAELKWGLTLALQRRPEAACPISGGRSNLSPKTRACVKPWGGFCSRRGGARRRWSNSRPFCVSTRTKPVPARRSIACEAFVEVATGVGSPVAKFACKKLTNPERAVCYRRCPRPLISKPVYRSPAQQRFSAGCGRCGRSRFRRPQPRHLRRSSR